LSISSSSSCCFFAKFK